MHEILIALVIIIVVAAQLFVGYTTWKKINFYREIIPDSENFETVKVYIPESQVKDIKIDHILINLNYFQFPQEEEEFSAFDITPDADSQQIIERAGQNIEPEEGDLIWVTKGNEEKKIEYTLLSGYLKDGWNQI